MLSRICRPRPGLSSVATLLVQPRSFGPHVTGVVLVVEVRGDIDVVREDLDRPMHSAAARARRH